MDNRRTVHRTATGHAAARAAPGDSAAPSGSPRRRRRILTTLTRLPLRATVYRAVRDNGATEADLRRRCLLGLVGELPPGTRVQHHLELDASLRDLDRRTLFREVRRRGLGDRVRYEHLPAASDPLLALPDCIAWAFARGGPWRRRLDGLVTCVVDV